ncbi:MAG: EF-hand domain-containing protein [Pseudomonadota bacterium]
MADQLQTTGLTEIVRTILVIGMALPFESLAESPEDSRTAKRALPSAEQRRLGVFQELDKNGDGKLRLEELRSSASSNQLRMRLIDIDKDGMISLEEFLKYDSMETRLRTR